MATKPEHDTHEQPTAANYTAGELPALPAPAETLEFGIARGFRIDGDCYTADQMHAYAREALAASHCAQGSSQQVVRGDAVAEVGPGWTLVWVGSEPIAQLLARHPYVRIGTKLYAAPPSQPADKPARQADVSQPLVAPASPTAPVTDAQIERAARALCVSRGLGPNTMHQVSDGYHFDHEDSRGLRFIFGWRLQAEHAKAALEAAALTAGDTPRCPKCGYTEEDCRFHLDHHLCGEPPRESGSA